MKHAAGVTSSVPPTSLWRPFSPVKHLVSSVAQVTGLNNVASLIRDGSIPSA